MKKLLFLLLPLMVLSSCGVNQQAKEEEPLQYKEATEDVVDVFGENNFAAGEGKKYRFGAEEKDPALGFQTMTYTRDAVQYYAIRFTAALAAEPTSAVWTRNVYQVSGGAKATTTANKPSSVFYTALYDGTGNRYTPEEEVGTGYNCFAVYTMYDIPVDEADDYYIEAYLTVDTKTTKVGVASKRNHFSYPLGTTGYFLAVNSNGTTKSRIYKGNSNKTNGSNYAEIWADLKENETFILVNIHDNELDTYDYATYMSDKNKADFDGVSGSDFCQVKEEKANHYFFYVSGGEGTKNVMYVNPADAYYLKPGVWDVDGAKFALYTFNDEETKNYWMQMTPDVDHTGLYVAYFDKEKDYSKYPNGIFVRLDPAGGLNWDNRWNQTANLTLQVGKLYEITGWEENDDDQWKDLIS